MKNSFIKKLLTCSIISSLSLNANAVELDFIEINGNITDIPNSTGQMTPTPPLPVAPSGIPAEMQTPDPFSGFDFFNNPYNIGSLSQPSNITFLQSNPSTEEVLNLLYNQLYLYPPVDIYGDFFVWDPDTSSYIPGGPDNFSTATRNYMTSTDFINHLQSSAVQDASVPDKLTLPSSGSDTVAPNFYIKFLGNHTVSVDSLYLDPMMPGSTQPYYINSIDLNGNNAVLNLNNGETSTENYELVLGSVVDNLSGGSLNINLRGSESMLVLSGDKLDASSGYGISSTLNTYQNVNFNFDGTNLYLIGIGSDPTIPLVLSGTMTNMQNANLVVGDNLVISNNIPNLNFKSIFRVPMGPIGVLTIDNPSIPETTITSKWQGTIYVPWINSYQSVGSPGVLHAKTPVIITDGSIGLRELTTMTYPPMLRIGDDGRDSSISLAADSDEINIGSTAFYSKNSSLILSSENASNDVDFIISASSYLGSSIYDPSLHSSSISDLSGIIKMHALGNKINLRDLDDFGFYGIGQSSSARAKEAIFSGDSQITLNVPVNAGNLTFDNSNRIELGMGAKLGESGGIKLLQDATLAVDQTNGLNASSAIIDLGNNTLNIVSGNIILTGKSTIISDFNSADGKYGKITVGGEANIVSMNLSELESLKILFNSDTANEELIQNMNNSQIEYSLKLIEELENGTLNDSGLSEIVNITPSEVNPLVSWNYDETTHSLVSTTNWTGLQEFVENNQENLPNSSVSISNEITNSALTFLNNQEKINSDKSNEKLEEAKSIAASAGLKPTRIIQAILQGANTIEEATETVKALKAEIDKLNDDSGLTEQSSLITDRMIANSVTPSLPSFSPSTTNIVAPTSPSISNIPASDVNFTPTTGNIDPATLNTQPSPSGSSVNTTITPNNQQNVVDTQNQASAAAAADGTPLGMGIAAGDDLSSKYGVWFSPFYQKGIQRKIGIDNGYKVTNHGGIIGIDYKINEDVSIGFAWSNIKSILKQTEEKQGSKAITHSNIFSLYGAFELPKNYFVTAIASHGISNIKNSERRPLTSKKFEFAKSKFTTKIYSTQLLAGKNMPFRHNYVFTPLAGVKYTEFHEGSYNEKGATLINFSSTKKRSSLFDGLIGAKLTYNTNYKGYIVSPHIGGMAHINLKDNPPTSYISSDAFLNTIKVKGEKRSQKVWYTIDVGVDFSKDNMEYTISYENQIDKKYVGHQAKMKVKVNL